MRIGPWTTSWNIVETRSVHSIRMIMHILSRKPCLIIITDISTGGGRYFTQLDRKSQKWGSSLQNLPTMPKYGSTLPGATTSTRGVIDAHYVQFIQYVRFCFDIHPTFWINNILYHTFILNPVRYYLLIASHCDFCTKWLQKVVKKCSQTTCDYFINKWWI